MAALGLVDEGVAQALSQLHLTQIFFCSLYAVLIWDWLVSLEREYKWIWKKKFTIPSYLYISSRYLPLITMPVILWINSTDHTFQECKNLFNVPPLVSQWYQLSAEAVLLLRTYVFFGRQKVVAVGLSLALTTVAVYQIYVALREMVPLPFVSPATTMGPCFPTSRYDGSPHVILWFITPLIFDTIVVFMTIYKAVRIKLASANEEGPKLLQIFVREGVFYYILIGFANLANGLIYSLPQSAISALAVPLSLSLPVLIACRLVLGLREQGTALSFTYDESEGSLSDLPRWRRTSVATHVRGTTPLQTIQTTSVIDPQLSTLPPDSPMKPVFFEQDPYRGKAKSDAQLNVPSSYRYR